MGREFEPTRHECQFIAHCDSGKEASQSNGRDVPSGLIGAAFVSIGDSLEDDDGRCVLWRFAATAADIFL